MGCNHAHTILYPERQKISRLFMILVSDGYKACRNCGEMFLTRDVHCKCCGYKFSVVPTRSGKKSDNLKQQLELVKRY